MPVVAAVHGLLILNNHIHCSATLNCQILCNSPLCQQNISDPSKHPQNLWRCAAESGTKMLAADRLSPESCEMELVHGSDLFVQENPQMLDRMRSGQSRGQNQHPESPPLYHVPLTMSEPFSALWKKHYSAKSGYYCIIRDYCFYEGV